MAKINRENSLREKRLMKQARKDARKLEFGGRRPYHFQDERQSASGRWEIWMDGDQAEFVRAARSG